MAVRPQSRTQSHTHAPHGGTAHIAHTRTQRARIQRRERGAGRRPCALCPRGACATPLPHRNCARTAPQPRTRAQVRTRTQGSHTGHRSQVTRASTYTHTLQQRATRHKQTQERRRISGHRRWTQACRPVVALEARAHALSFSILVVKCQISESGSRISFTRDQRVHGAGWPGRTRASGVPVPGPGLGFIIFIVIASITLH